MALPDAPSHAHPVQGDGTHIKEAALPGAAQRLLSRLRTKEARMGVVGLGYVGLPLAAAFADRGFDVVGIDVQDERVDRLNAGENYIEDLEDDEVRRLVEAGHLRGTTELTADDDVDIIFVCVPTPVTETNEPDTSYIEAAARTIADQLRPGQLVILKSTTHPETTETVVQPLLAEAGAESGLTLGEEYFLAHSPERIDPGNEEYTTANTPVVVGGVTDACTTVAVQTLEEIVEETVPVSSPKVAEMEKLLENIFRSVNIALVNELAQLCERVEGLSMWEVVDAAATKPFGFMPFRPGPGVGGHCIPVDPYYLSWLATSYDFETSFITLSSRINEEMPHHVVDAVVDAIARQPVRLQDAEILILGVAFKGNVSDTRHSPAKPIIRELQKKGVGTIRYHDPHVETFEAPAPGTEASRTAVPSVELTAEVLRGHEATVIVTDHDAFEARTIAEHAPAIVDTRNALGDVTDPALREKISLLGA